MLSVDRDADADRHGRDAAPRARRSTNVRTCGELGYGESSTRRFTCCENAVGGQTRPDRVAGGAAEPRAAPRPALPPC